MIFHGFPASDVQIFNVRISTYSVSTPGCFDVSPKTNAVCSLIRPGRAVPRTMGIKSGPNCAVRQDIHLKAWLHPDSSIRPPGTPYTKGWCKDSALVPTNWRMNNAHYDFIIIGSGAGGGTLAYHLAPSGKKILLIERGPFVRREK